MLIVHGKLLIVPNSVCFRNYDKIWPMRVLGLSSGVRSVVFFHLTPRLQWRGVFLSKTENSTNAQTRLFCNRLNVARRLGSDTFGRHRGGQMQINYQQCWCFAPSGAPQYAITTKPGVLRRTLRRVGGQIIVLAFILLDIVGLEFALVASVWLVPWVTINLTALVLGTLGWNEDRRIHRESATATQRQAEKVRAAQWRRLEKMQREAQRQQEARCLRQAEQLRQAERRRRREDGERKAQRQLEAALRQAEEQLWEAEQRRRQEQEERETQRQREQAERLHQAKQQRREAEQRRRQAEEEREAHRERNREQKCGATQSQTDWWTVLGVARSATKAEIVRNYRHKIKQCHPDRVVGHAPELLQMAEEQTKVLNGAYANAIRASR
jgi:hypothetical protein